MIKISEIIIEGCRCVCETANTVAEQPMSDISKVLLIIFGVFAGCVLIYCGMLIWKMIKTDREDDDGQERYY